MPGAGKSTIANGLKSKNFEIINMGDAVREEAKKLGGLGICGNQLCCCSFMDSFSPISTNDAKEQNLPMNPSKLSGICGRLKCCLMFEKCSIQNH